MPEIKVTIRDKVAIANGVVYVCGNSDYTMAFDFDPEWEAYETKTARFVYGEKYTDVVFSGNTCQVPVLTNLYGFKVGVFAGDLHTTTPAKVAAKKSILCGEGAPADPPADVYNQIMEKLNSGGSGGDAPFDWNASDGEPGHVLNRTHYEETVVNEVAVLAETTVTTTAGSNGLNMKTLTGSSAFSEGQFVVGDTYIVEYDGVPYTCIAGDYQLGYLGNPVLHTVGVNNSLQEDNRFPFGMVRGTASMCQIGTSEPGDHTFKVTHLITETVVHKLEPKYLPEGIGYAETAELVNGTATDMGDGNLGMETDAEFVAGKTYNVTYNGVEYTCTAFELDGGDGAMYTAIGNGVSLGMQDTGEPFIMMIMFGALLCMDYNGATEATVRIMGEKVFPIPLEYLTNAIPYYVDVFYTTDGSGNVSGYTCTDKVANVEAAIRFGRQIIARVSGEGAHADYLAFFAPLSKYIPKEVEGLAKLELTFHGFGNLATLGASGTYHFYLIPQADGTYVASATNGS